MAREQAPPSSAPVHPAQHGPYACRMPDRVEEWMRTMRLGVQIRELDGPLGQLIPARP